MESGLKKEFKAVSYVATTADCWTKMRRGYLGMTAHWIHPDTMERQSAVIALQRMNGSHTHERLAAEMHSVYKRYQLEAEQLVKCTTDSAANFKKAFHMYSSDPNQPERAVAEAYVDEEGNEEDKGENKDTDDECQPVSVDALLSQLDLQEYIRLPSHHRCGAHLINLIAVTDAKEALEDASYKRMHQSVESKLKVWWRRENMSELVATTIKAGLGVKLVVPGETRWNSELDAKSQIVKLCEEEKSEEKLNRALESAGLRKLLSAELQFLREYVHVMQPLAFALDILQRDKNMFIGYLIPTILRMESKIRAKREMNGKPLKYWGVLLNTVISSIRKSTRFDPYLTDPDLAVAACLIPCFKLNWVTDSDQRENIKVDILRELETLSAGPRWRRLIL